MTEPGRDPGTSAPTGPLSHLLRFCLEQKLVVFVAAAMLLSWGVLVAPFDWDLGGLPRDPVPVDAIPDLGENQQIVFTEWMGRSPQDVEDQVTYPLTVALQGIPGVESIRSYSYFGFSSIYVVFEEGVDFYWSRSRILEKLASLPADTLPPDVNPALGPDATALGQVYWYTLEGRDPDGHPVGGWDLDELRAVQDYTVRYALAGTRGVAEAASVGGFVREYQIDIDPDAMRAAGVTLAHVYDAIQRSNLDVSAGTIEHNRVEYMIRGLGFINTLDDIKRVTVTSRDNTPITVDQLAKVSLGPAPRRGVLDKDGAEAVGGVVTARYGVNPLQVILGIHETVHELAPGLPRKAVIDWSQVDRETVASFAEEQGFSPFSDPAGFLIDHEAWLGWLEQNDRDDWPAWITTSQIAIVPFYDRSGLIYETLNTLNDALFQQVLITTIVVLIMVLHVRSSLLISAMLPMAILLTFVGMKLFGVDANVVALAGIAIAIGTVVDVGIVLCENVLKHLDAADDSERRLDVVYRACREVGGAVLTAVLTTVVGFLPVVTMIGAEGKLFRPLAFTKTFALVASILIALMLLPPLCQLILTPGRRFGRLIPQRVKQIGQIAVSLTLAAAIAVLLAQQWEPLGKDRSLIVNLAFVVLLVGGLLLAFRLFQLAYASILQWALDHKLIFLSMPLAVVVLGLCVWLGVGNLTGWLPDSVKRSALWQQADAAFPGLGSEFMPALDEGSFLYMPTTMPHASIGQSAEVLRQLDASIRSVPEVEMVVGKVGRADSPLDPAPISMVETVIHYKPEYAVDINGRHVRQWRDSIRSPDDIWAEVQAAAQLPGVTSAPKLQPIETRLVMLQTGMRAPMGIKVRGPDLETIEAFGYEIERILRDTPGVNPATVNADRIVGTPYLEIDIDRDAIARYGVNVADVQRVIEVAIGGRDVTTTVEGRERFDVRVRYMRELRDSIDSFSDVLVSSVDRTQQVPLTDLAELRYARGPRMIKSEDTFLVGYVTFGPEPGLAEMDVINNVRNRLDTDIADGSLSVPPGVSYRFAGNFENQVRAAKTLMVVLPLSLGIIFMILYLQFRSVTTALIIFSGIAVAWAGGFLLIWCYNQPWFLNVALFGENMREVFQVQSIKLSVAVWVGFLALFGIATDDGVVMATYIKQRFAEDRPATSAEVKQATLEAGRRRVRPCLMTTATTILALLPVLTATGRGSDIMLPMALPSVGGMSIALLTMFVVPVLTASVHESRLKIVS
ncbi:MAG: efflux RND transporter permease subunit [Planctomycetota bacterium]